MIQKIPTEVIIHKNNIKIKMNCFLQNIDRIIKWTLSKRLILLRSFYRYYSEITTKNLFSTIESRKFHFIIHFTFKRTTLIELMHLLRKFEDTVINIKFGDCLNLDLAWKMWNWMNLWQLLIYYWSVWSKFWTILEISIPKFVL